MAIRFMGIEFVPILSTPLQRRLQMIGVIYHFLFAAFLFYLPFIMLFFPTTWPVLLLAVIWAYYDWASPRRGGYDTLWVQKWGINRYFAEYFPLKFHKTANLPPGQNYLIGSHPHGIISTGSYATFCTNGVGIFEEFPEFTIKHCTLVEQFWIPIRREFLLLHGLIDCSKESLQYMLDVDSTTNNIVVLVIGGAAEALECHHDNYTLTLKNRKGFVKMALKTGAQLVPMITFGEVDLFDQVDNPKGSLLRTIQEYLRKWMRCTTPLFHGRGIFTYNLGFLPHRRALNCVLGAPIPVKKMDEPEQADIDALHSKYLEALTNLFEKHKATYGLDESVKMTFD